MIPVQSIPIYHFFYIFAVVMKRFTLIFMAAAAFLPLACKTDTIFHDDIHVDNVTYVKYGQDSQVPEMNNAGLYLVDGKIDSDGKLIGEGTELFLDLYFSPFTLPFTSDPYRILPEGDFFSYSYVQQSGKTMLLPGGSHPGGSLIGFRERGDRSTDYYDVTRGNVEIEYEGDGIYEIEAVAYVNNDRYEFEFRGYIYEWAPN